MDVCSGQEFSLVFGERGLGKFLCLGASNILRQPDNLSLKLRFHVRSIRYTNRTNNRKTCKRPVGLNMNANATSRSLHESFGVNNANAIGQSHTLMFHHKF